MTGSIVGPLRIFAAGSLRPAFEVLAGSASDRVEIEYANARDLGQRIAAGEDVDVFASASPDHPADLRAAGLVEEPRPFASNRLVIAVPQTSAATGLDVLVAPSTRAIIEVAGIPLGDYTRELLRRLDEVVGEDFARRALGNVVAQEQTVDAVAARLEAGEADAAVLYATDVLARPGRLRAIELPSTVAVPVTCVACVVAATSRRAAARACVTELTGPAVVAVMRRAGFGPAPAGGTGGTEAAGDTKGTAT